MVDDDHMLPSFLHNMHPDMDLGHMPVKKKKSNQVNG